VTAASELPLAQMRVELEGLPWGDRFDRLALEDKGASVERRADLAALRAELGDRALAELSAEWAGVPHKAGILRLTHKRLRGALGQAAKRARDRAVLAMLPQGAAGFAGRFGVGFDERVIEVPLALQIARLETPGAVLDAGFALNLPVVRQAAGRPQALVTHFTQDDAGEPLLPGDGDRYLRAFGDLRAMPFEDGAFDRVVCVSTLEHVGMDNARYGGASEQAPESAATAVAELVRVMAPRGELLITVPYGRAASHGWFRVFDADGLSALLRPAAGLRVEVRYFFYDRGWAEGDATPPAAALEAGFAEDVVTGVAAARVTRGGAPWPRA
jgi:SAM-dependent methyltransferase